MIARTRANSSRGRPSTLLFGMSVAFLGLTHARHHGLSGCSWQIMTIGIMGVKPCRGIRAPNPQIASESLLMGDTETGALIRINPDMSR